ncbi:MAG: class 1 fructose-bisphosphatase [Desulfovibrionaceae bacterium]
MSYTTLNEYCTNEQITTNLDSELLSILLCISSCAKQISWQLTNAACTQSLGLTGDTNIQGEQVQKLDLFSHTIFVDALRELHCIAGVSSEESEEYIFFENTKKGSYLINFDPLDGSSNLDTNINVGSIFSIIKKPTSLDIQLTENDFLQSMNSLVGAGYILYGPSTILVISLGFGVQAFTFSKERDQFLLTHPHITIPEYGHIYSVNEGYTKYWDPLTKKIVTYFKENNTKTGKVYSHRYVGSLVADIHRTLLYGGIFLYPTMYSNGKKKDKLRLLYETIPLSYIIEQAGGKATKGKESIASIRPESIHSRSALYIGSQYEMNIIETILCTLDA